MNPSTLDELLKNAPRKTVKKVRSFSLPLETLDKLKYLANRYSVSISKVIEILIDHATTPPPDYGQSEE